MRFYFTLHPSDFIRQRIVPGSHGMLVASSLWRHGKLRIRRPPPHTVASLVLDSGGFTAATKWGQYPWSIGAYAEWGQMMTRAVPVSWIATMDYACERGVARDVYATNRQRIQATVDNAVRCLAATPALPWLPVVQGSTMAEYGWCIAQYAQQGLLRPYMGLGTMCGRPWHEAQQLLQQLAIQYPAQRWHVFGLDMRVLRNDLAASVVESWDSYAWNWPAGTRHDAGSLTRMPGETYSAYCQRLACDYQRRVGTMLRRERTLSLFQARALATHR